MTTPAPASFFSRLQTFERSKSYDGAINQLDTTAITSVVNHGAVNDNAGGGSGAATPSLSSGHASGTSTPTLSFTAGQADMRRAVSMRVTPSHAAASMSSFGAAGSAMSPEPLASRHPLFSHHRIPSSTATSVYSASGGVGGGSGFTRTAASFGIGGIAGPSRPSGIGISTAGVGMGNGNGTSEAGPPSPSPSERSMGSSSAFSPASAFLSHFSSVRSPVGSVLGVGSSTGPGTGMSDLRLDGD